MCDVNAHFNRIIIAGQPRDRFAIDERCTFVSPGTGQNLEELRGAGHSNREIDGDHGSNVIGDLLGITNFVDGELHSSSAVGCFIVAQLLQRYEERNEGNHKAERGNRQGCNVGDHFSSMGPGYGPLVFESRLRFGGGAARLESTGVRVPGGHQDSCSFPLADRPLAPPGATDPRESIKPVRENGFRFFLPRKARPVPISAFVPGSATLRTT